MNRQIRTQFRGSLIGIVAFVALLAAGAARAQQEPLIVILPSGAELRAERVDVMPFERMVFIFEAPLFRDGFEDPPLPANPCAYLDPDSPTALCPCPPARPGQVCL